MNRIEKNKVLEKTSDTVGVQARYAFGAALIVDDHVCALGIIGPSGGRAAVLDGHFAHVSCFFGREALKCDTQRVQRFHLEFFELCCIV